MGRAEKKRSGDTSDLIAAVSARVAKVHGAEAALRASTNEGIHLSKVRHWASTGNLQIDRLLRGGRPDGCPVVPFGRLTVISGRQHAGKTTLLGQIVAQAQKMGAIAVVMDTERTLDLETYWTRLGVDMDKLILSKAHTIEDVYERAETFMGAFRDEAPDVPVLIGHDSVGLTPTRQELKGENEWNNVARAMGMCVRQVISIVADHGAAFIVLSDLYRQMGSMHPGDTWTEYGGEKILRWATLLIRLSRGPAIPDGNDTVGNLVRVQVRKNKLGPRLMESQVALLGDHGFSNDYAVYSTAEDLGLIVKKGSWKSWVRPDADPVAFQGWRGFQEHVMGHEAYPTLVAAVQEHLGKGLP